MAVSAAAIPCFLDVPAPLRDGLAYALCTLLRPLGLEPAFRDALPEDGPVLFYGDAEKELPRRVVVVHRAPDVIDFFREENLRRPDDVAWCTWKGEWWPVLFGSERAPDLLASAFYWLSGWQEHHARARDEHYRFPVEASLQAKLDVLRRPPVDAYREMLAEQLTAAGVTLRRRKWGNRHWAFCPTFDVDYVRKWRPGILYREAVQHFLMNGRQVDLRERMRRFGASLWDALTPGDPYFSALSRLREEVLVREGKGTIFFKAGAHDPHDVDYCLETPALKREVRSFLDAGFEVGLHPSYDAHASEPYLHEERDRLTRWCGEEPLSVRQHYLRYQPIVTPRLHEQLGFRIDSTLGFAKEVGFRHGTCLPFRLYDLDAWREMEVWEMSLTFMEGALFVRREMDTEEAQAATDALLAVCRRFGGVGVGLWHNVLWDEEDYPEWGQHFTTTLDHAGDQGAQIASLRDALSSWLGAPTGATSEKDSQRDDRR